MNAAEQIIWAELVVKANNAALEIKKAWVKSQHLTNFAISWVSEPIIADDKSIIDDMIMIDLPPDFDRETLKAFVVRSKSMALLLARQHQKGVSVLLESIYGAELWLLPMQRRGDFDVLGDPVVIKEPSEEFLLHLLWKPRR